MKAVPQDAVLLPVNTSNRVKKSSKVYRLFNALVLISIAAILSFVREYYLRSYEAYVTPAAHESVFVNPADQWADNIWPLREQTPWDISTNYPFPRLLEYDVTEGTWLRLDVHPTSGDIVFDMLGDIYCLPAGAYSAANLESESFTRARPVLLGVPHDSDPHFSPNGDKLVFRSDAGLGIENIWITEWQGCDETDVRPLDPSWELLNALKDKNAEEEQLAITLEESHERKTRRLIREGRLKAYRVTNETYRWVSDVRFHPSGEKLIATKWYTSGRSLGAGEGWEYPVPKEDAKIEVGSGKRIVSRTLPPGWGPERYGDQQIGPEQFIWLGNDTLIYSKNVKDTNGVYTYSKDAHKGTYSIFSTNLTTGETVTLVDSFPGGATRPELSRDQRTLAFVRRVRDKEALVLKDLVTGTIRNIWHGLTYDLSVISAPMGTYPSFAFTPKDDAIIIWAAGQIYHVPLAVNDQGEKIGSGSPKAIKFIAHVEKRLAATVTSSIDLTALETADTQRIHAFTDLRVNEDGSKALFQGAGATYVHSFTYEKGKASKAEIIPSLYPDAPYYSPSFVSSTNDLVIHARWSDTNFTTFELANLTSGTAYELDGLALGRYYSPILCECQGSERLIAFIKTSGDYITGDIVATARPGLYLGKLTLPSSESSAKSKKITIEDVRFITSSPATDDPAKTKIRFLEKNQKILVQQTQDVYIIDLAAGPNEFGRFPEIPVANGQASTELVVASPGGKVDEKSVDVAFVDFYHVYFAPAVNANNSVWSRPGNATDKLARLSLDGGHDLTWSGDGKTLFWFLGPYIHALEVSELSKCSGEIEEDALYFGFKCTTKLLHYEEIVAEYPTDISRLKKDVIKTSPRDYGYDQNAMSGADLFVIYNATLLTMDTGYLNTDVLHDALLVVKDGQINTVAGIHNANFTVPHGATTVDVQGGFVVPGFIDVHAHWDGFDEFYPARSWELETFLAYGVTTLHNPSADNVRGFWERFRVERGHAIGPRIFQVGNIIYGAGEAAYHQDIENIDEAYSALIRIKAEGGPASFSYKNYNLPSRASRQRLLLAARKLNMLCVPEGGMNYDWDQTYIVDGMTTIEHPLPIPQLYDDIITLYALSGTGSTPTHIVNYGGVFGEQAVWANEDLPNDPKLRRFTRHDILEGLAESTSRPKDSYALFNTSVSTAKMVQKGLRAHIGAHGEPPLGLNYHEEMYFTKAGGLSNYEVIRAATADAAKTLGLWSSLGSLSPGKLADFLIYPPGIDLLDGDISATRSIKQVVRGGRVWDADTLEGVWPVKGRKEPLPPLNPE